MNAYFHTLGCKVNQYETQAMMALMRRHGYVTAVYHADSVKEGSVIVVNSCTVTGESDRKLRQLLRRMRREHPACVLVLTGCMPQAFPDKASALESADIVLGNARRQELPAAVDAFLTTGQRVIAITPHDKRIESLCIEDFEERTRAFVKIEDGCDRFCSYCIIPYARGRVRSRPLDELQTELQTLVKKGYCEVVLVGINLTSFGKDNGLTLADAVEAACAVEGIERVRLGSLEPDHLTEELISRLKGCPKLCPQFHVALQSGCDTTLRRMNRHYTAAEYEKVCQRLLAAFPDGTLTTDIMVGFPGETEADFENSLEFARRMRFSKAHVFPYSKRAGTNAAKMPDQIGNQEKMRRARRMTEVLEAVRREILLAAVGTEQEVLCETRTADGGALGYTRGYWPCRLKGDCLAGQTVTARITHVDGDRLVATVI